jgi:hypothetical protein
MTAYELDDQVSIPERGRDYFLSHRVQIASEDHITFYSMGTGEKQQQQHEAHHSPESISKVKNEWSYTSTPIRLHGLVLN